MITFLSRSWQKSPPFPAEINWANPLTRGLKAFYLLSAARWPINLATQRVAGVMFGTPLYVATGSYIDVYGAAGTYIDLGVPNVTFPLSVSVGYSQYSGSVSWSLLRRDAGNWYGVYGGSGGGILTVNNNVFDGSVTPAAGGASRFLSPHVAVSVEANNLRAVNTGGVVAVDSSCTLPTGTYTGLALGGSLRSDVFDNVGQSYFDHVAVWDRALTDAEKCEISINTWQLVRPMSARIYSFPTGAASSTVPPLYHQRQQQGMAS